MTEALNTVSVRLWHCNWRRCPETFRQRTELMAHLHAEHWPNILTIKKDEYGAYLRFKEGQSGATGMLYVFITTPRPSSNERTQSVSPVSRIPAQIPPPPNLVKIPTEATLLNLHARLNVSLHHLLSRPPSAFRHFHAPVVRLGRHPTPHLKLSLEPMTMNSPRCPRPARRRASRPQTFLPQSGVVYSRRIPNSPRQCLHHPSIRCRPRPRSPT